MGRFCFLSSYCFGNRQTDYKGRAVSLQACEDIHVPGERERSRFAELQPLIALLYQQHIYWIEYHAMTSEVPLRPANIATQLDLIAGNDPDRTYCRLVKGREGFEGIEDVTFGQLRDAVNSMSFWLDDILGPSKNFDAFAYYGEPDIRYAMVVTAAAKTQRKVCLTPLHLHHDEP